MFVADDVSASEFELKHNRQNAMRANLPAILGLGKKEKGFLKKRNADGDEYTFDIGDQGFRNQGFRNQGFRNQRSGIRDQNPRRFPAKNRGVFFLPIFLL
ncbi:MAG: hypothetical protein LBG61_07830 [Burkholderiales bacterium]|nr:hypothetical protein [Burkholderiales bacterium]